VNKLKALQNISENLGVFWFFYIDRDQNINEINRAVSLNTKDVGLNGSS